MADSKNMAVRITAIDATSAAFDAVARRLAGLTAPATKLTKSFARLSDASGVTRLSKAVAHLGGTAVRTSERFVSALAPLGGITAALSVAGFAKMTSDWAHFSRSLSFDATRIGSGVSQLHALEGSAALAGSSAEAASLGLRNLQDVMVDTVGGRNNEALVYFRQLGVAFDDGRGHALRATAVLPKLADAIAKIKDPSLQARVATQFFGGAAESLLPWLRKGSAGMAEYAALARHYGVETEGSTAAAEVFSVAQTRLALAFKGLGYAISEKVSPPLSELMVWMSELIARNRGMISDKFGYWAKQLADWIKSIDWDKTGKYFSDLFDRFERWTDAMSKFSVPLWMKKMFGLGDDVSAPSVEVTPDGKIAMPRPGGVESDAPPLTPGQHTDLGKLMMGMFEGKGWQHDDAAAIISGLDRESGLRSGAVGDNGQAYGAAQWHPDRQAQFDAWSKNGGTSDGRDIRHSSMADQADFINWDLTKGKYKSVGDHMRGAKTIEEKMGIFDREYESPADTAGAIRSDIPRAQQWAAQSATKPGAAAPAATPAETPDDRPSWVDKLDDGPLKRLLQGSPRTAASQDDVRLAPPPEEPLPRPVAGDSRHEVVIKVQAPPGTQTTTTTTGSGPAAVLIHRAMP